MDSTNNAVKIAIVGTGMIGPRHAQAVLGNPEAKLTCIVDPLPAAQAVADGLGVPRLRSVQELLESEHKPDAAYVCTPNRTHVGISKELLSGGVNVLVEKPISPDIQSGQDLVSHASRQKLSLLVGHHRRFNSYIRSAKQLLDQSRLGQIIAISGLWGLHKPLSYFDEPTTWRRSSKYGGPILINLIHEVDMLHYLIGPIVRVHAEETIKQRGFDAEEGVALVLKFENGVVGTFVLSDAVSSPWSYEQGTGDNPLFPATRQGFLRILGSAGSLSLGDMETWTYGGAEQNWSNDIVKEKVNVKEEIAFELQVEHLIRVLRGQERPICSGEDGLRAVIVCEAVKKSMATKLPVDIATMYEDATEDSKL
ncbi:NAD(P)-binding protein [Rhizodiscina lignyota]|uniref:NAD(P)-binding protein n=1 Tax=Rhizodiscina lignyota TaxID=1504668 RepID=A0A9P4IAC6_9PEZI|nr:NAD(P)-binding protein [Rhizodiscina lignyota]